MGETLGDLPTLERLLRNNNPDAHDKIADVLWEADNDQDAVTQLRQLANTRLSLWEADASPQGTSSESDATKHL